MQGGGSRPVTWRFWAASAAAAAAYLTLGLMPRVQDHDADIYKWGLLAATVVIVAFTGAWTLIGLVRPQAARWWRTDMATSLVVVSLADLPNTGGYAWVFWFGHGHLAPGFLAWVVLSSPLLLAAAVGWRTAVWFRALELRRQGLRRPPAGRSIP